MDKDETRWRKKGRKAKRLLLAARRGSRTSAAAEEDARWADANDGFSKQEWNPAQPIVGKQVDRVRVAKPFEVLAGFLASSAGGLLFQGVKARRS